MCKESAARGRPPHAGTDPANEVSMGSPCASRSIRIAQVAPLYEPVPPRLYGGTERVVSYLTEELVAQGHDVTLFASGDSVTSARLVPASPRALRHELLRHVGDDTLGPAIEPRRDRLVERRDLGDPERAVAPPRFRGPAVRRARDTPRFHGDGVSRIRAGTGWPPAPAALSLHIPKTRPACGRRCAEERKRRSLCVELDLESSR